jgi:hypothetical protein
MKRFWLGAFAIMVAVGGVLLAQDDDPDIFDAPFSMVAVPFHGNSVTQSITSFTSDKSQNPQTVFHPGEFVAWTSEFFVVPKGAGSQTEHISVQATTPRRTRTLGADFSICNTSNPNVCDDIPDFTEWSLTIFLKNPIPQFFNKLLLRTGPIPFSSVVTGTGYEGFVANLDGNSVAALQ